MRVRHKVAGLGIGMRAGFVRSALPAGSMAVSSPVVMPLWCGFEPLPVFGQDNEMRQAMTTMTPREKKKTASWMSRLAAGRHIATVCGSGELLQNLHVSLQ